MKIIRSLLAKTAATHFIWGSFSMPRALSGRTFLRIMNSLFSRLAPSYDRLGTKLGPEKVILGPLSAASRRLSETPERILDLACGTGLATCRLREIFPDSLIVGADLSLPMVRELKRKTDAEGSKSVYPLVCNSGRLPFGDNQFDLVVTQNAPPYPEEMVRVLRPGGRLFLVYSFVFVTLVQGVIRRRLERLGLKEIDFVRAEEGVAAVAVKPV